MGVCFDKDKKNFTIKIKRKKKHKTKDHIEEMNFEIIDINNDKTLQILTKTNITLRELLAMGDIFLTEDFDV